MKLLLDENLPHRLRLELPGHAVFTAAWMGWSGIKNGKLLQLAADAGFDAVITNDRGLEYQQNQETLPVSVIVVLAPANTLEALRPFIPALLEAAATLKTGALVKVPGS